jgi:hypothetical protein
MRPKPSRPDRNQELDVDPEPAPPPVRRGPVRVESRGAPNLALRRLSERSGAVEDDIERSDVDESLPPGAPGVEASDPVGKSRDPDLPAFLPNRIIDLMASVVNQTDSDRFERRVFKVARLVACLVLAGLVLVVVTFAFRSRGRRSSAADSGRPSIIEPVRMPNAADWEARMARARGEVQEFFASSDVGRKCELILDGASESVAVRRHYETTGGKESGRPLLDQAQAKQAGERMILLVPIQIEGGGVRTAAVLETAQGFFLDWRSAVTPESMTLSDFMRLKPAEAQLFRVNAITPADGGTPGGVPAAWRSFRLQRDGVELIGATPGGSRVSEDLDRRAAAANGGVFSADLHLRFDPSLPGDGMVRIVGVTPEKWNL